ncbi:PH domain-containing protein [Angustibacter peucedani]
MAVRRLGPVGPHDAGPPPPVSEIGRRQVQRYLLPTESPVITTRRHLAVVAEPVASAVGGVVLAGLVVAKVGDSFSLLTNVVALGAVVLVLRMLWNLYEWRRDWFVVTDERLLLTYGILTRRVAVMPLSKVTDMSYNVSVVGRLLGYGEFVFESAGQEQALHTVNFLGRSQFLFSVLSAELFGPQGIASSRRFRPRHDD